jgi:hypothetical protein
MTPLTLGILTDKELPAFLETALLQAEEQGWLSFTVFRQPAPHKTGFARFDDWVYRKYILLETKLLAQKRAAPPGKFSQRAPAEITGLDRQRWDALLFLCERAPARTTQTAHGKWTFSASEYSAFWDVFHGRKTSVCELLADGRPIRRAVINTDPNSVVRQREHVVSKNTGLLIQSLRILHSQGKITQLRPAAYTPSRAAPPNLILVCWRLLQIFGRKLKAKLEGRFRFTQWSLMIALQENPPPDWNVFQPIVSPREVFWADPFPIERGGRRYIFIEEFLYSTRLGRIACLEIDDGGRVTDRRTVLEKPYHLSYPFIFEHQGRLFMIPESGKNKTVDLYSCTAFPYEWKFVKTLMEGTAAFDTTLLEHAGKWWMFVNLQDEGGSSWDTLHLFYADNPVNGRWTPHPLNPIVQDVSSARPAGRIFRRDGVLIRPSQDSSQRYGYATKFNRILRLSETEYEEQCEYTFAPARPSHILATHTWNSIAGLTAIDAVIYRRA